MLPGRSPLVDMAMSNVRDAHRNLRDNELGDIEEVFNSFVTGRIPYPEASRLLVQYLGDTSILDRISTIMQTPEQPLPVLSNPGPGARNSRAKTRPWTPYEDQRLLAGLHRYGFSDWTTIARFVGNGRSKSQCSQRWNRGLDPAINKAQWSAEEETILLQMIALYGDKCWTKIAYELGNRSDVQCRYHYKQMLREDKFAERMQKVREEVQNMPPGTLKTKKQSQMERMPYRGEVSVYNGMAMPPMGDRPVMHGTFQSAAQVPFQMPMMAPAPMYPVQFPPMGIGSLPAVASLPAVPLQGVGPVLGIPHMPSVPVVPAPVQPTQPMCVVPPQIVPAPPQAAAPPPPPPPPPPEATAAPEAPAAPTAPAVPPPQNPAAPAEPQGLKKQPSLIHFDDQISAQGSGFDWASVLRPSGSTGAFISPMGSMRFDNP